jgi:hypothetical protein
MAKFGRQLFGQALSSIYRDFFVALTMIIPAVHGSKSYSETNETILCGFAWENNWIIERVQWQWFIPQIH